MPTSTKDKLLQENCRLKAILREVLASLPADRDWLDPALEKEVVELVRGKNEKVIYN